MTPPESSPVGGLAVIHSGLPLAGVAGTAGPGPVLGAAGGNWLHCFTGTPRTKAQYFRLDHDGVLVEPPVATGLPPVHSVAGGPDELLVSCVDEVDGRAAPLLARVGFDGRVGRRGHLPIEGTLTRWPTLARSPETACCAWSSSNGEHHDWIAELVGDEPVERLVPVDIGAGPEATDLSVAAIGSDVLMASLLRGPPRVSLRRLRHGRVVTADELLDIGNPTFLRLYGGTRGWWLLWAEPNGTLLVRRLQPSAEDLAGGWEQPRAVYRAGPVDRVFDAHLLVGPVDAALLVRVSQPGGAHRHHFRDLLTVLAHEDDAPHSFLELSEPGTGYSAGGWVSGRLVVVHGAVQPLVTVLAHPSGERVRS